MLKFRLDSLDDLDDSIKGLYEEKGGKFFLKVEDLPKPETGDLEERLKKLEANNKDLLAEKIKAKEQAEAAALEAARKGGDIEALEKSWQEKLNSALSEKDNEINSYTGMVSEMTVGSTAVTIAAEIFGEHAELMLHHIKSRLTYEVVDGKPKVRVLDAEGKPSAKTVDELKAEFINSKKFAPFVVGSKANGGGAPPTGGGGSGVKKWVDMSDIERVKLKRENPTEYDRVVAEFKATK